MNVVYLGKGASQLCRRPLANERWRELLEPKPYDLFLQTGRLLWIQLLKASLK
jgi:hypothetical protein